MRLLKNTTSGLRVTITPVPDGIETAFMASHGIEPGTEDFICVYLNGALQHEGAGVDYTIGSFHEILKVHFNTAPLETDKLDIIYYGIGG